MPTVNIAGCASPTCVDDVLDLHIHTVHPDTPVTLHASFHDDHDFLWSSHATYISDSTGTIRLAHAHPLNGTYDEPDSMGLFWSMRPQPVSDNPQSLRLPGIFHTTRSLRPLAVTLRVSVSEKRIAFTTVQRYFLSDSIEQREQHAGSFHTTLFVPPGPGPHSAVVVLGGSRGGTVWSAQVAAVLASHGRAALAVSYFDWTGQPGLPDELVEIELKDFDATLDVLRCDERITLDDLALVGLSKGAELALVLATIFPAFRRVIAYVPSSVVWEGIPRVYERPRSSWMYDGVPLDFLPVYETYYHNRDEYRLCHYHEDALQDRATVERVHIPVEKIAGPLLLISATQDEVWPSALMADMIMQRLADHNHPYSSTHLCFHGAGHRFGVPFLPVYAAEQSTMAIQAHAEHEAWDALLRFLGIQNAREVYRGATHPQ